ncbi:unnamed protein product [Paramecium pentaurelia]|uniref:Uncharacterized protein n=1 Tax=Paramecium pentaurelia TaxID=43138 RepID=A0A8S1XLK6_9CILI|nr:unnamed protein product [Paramecium pentaurelia]
MGNLCASVRNSELTVEDASEILSIKIDDNEVVILQGDIRETQNKSILNACFDPYNNIILKQCRVKPEQLKQGVPSLIQLPRGIVKSEFMINLKINFDELSKQDLIDAFEESFEQLYFKEIDSISYYDQCEQYSKEIQIINCECFIEALINELHNNRRSRKYYIYHPNINICLMYKNEFKSQYSSYCRAKYSMIEQQNFIYGDVLQTIHEEFTEKNSQLALSITKLFKDYPQSFEKKESHEKFVPQMTALSQN